MNQKYFENSINWYNNLNAHNFYEKHPCIDYYHLLGFINNGNIAIFVNNNMYEETEIIPYFYVMLLNGEKFKVDYKFNLMSKGYENVYNQLKSTILSFMHLKYYNDGVHNIFNDKTVYSHFNFVWQVSQIKNNPFTRIFWNTIKFNYYNKKYFENKK